MDLSNNIVIQKSKDGFNYLQFKRLLDLGINHAYSLKPHAFNTRPGVVSIERINKNKENYKEFCKALGFDFNMLVKPNQTHTNVVKVVKNIPNGMSIEEDEYKDTDGLVTNIKGISLASVNADCILLLMYDPVKKVIANIHSGWKGTFGKIAVNAVNTMKDEYGCNPEDIITCICPSIRKCHFEVKEDVKNMCEEIFAYTNRLDDIIEYIGKDDDQIDKWKIDTVLITKILLKDCGIKDENIEDCGICSVCNKEIVNSRRADGENFGLATAIMGTGTKSDKMSNKRDGLL
jgi:hypothetical protein